MTKTKRTNNAMQGLDSSGAPLTPSANYQVLYIDNLRTMTGHYAAIVGGAAAIHMIANSTDPIRLSFERLGR